MDFLDFARSTFAARDFTEDPIPDDLLYRWLDVARFAPSGGNRQGWRIVVVRDAATKRQLAALCRPTWNIYIAQRQAGESPWSSVEPSALDLEQAAATDAPSPLLDDLEHAPVVLVVGVDLRGLASMDKDLDRVGIVSGASVYPFVWHLLLAARNDGYAGAMTTFLVAQERDAQTLVGFPREVAIAAMVPLGRPVKLLTKLSRAPVEDFARIGRFDGPPLRPTPGG